MAELEQCWRNNDDTFVVPDCSSEVSALYMSHTDPYFQQAAIVSQSFALFVLVSDMQGCMQSSA